MKKQKLMTAKRIIFALTLAVMIAVPAHTLRAQSSDEPTIPQTTTQGGGILDVLEQIRQAQAQQLEGSWAVTVTPVLPPGAPPMPPSHAHATFSRGGGLFGSDRTRPFGKHHGTWAHTGGNEFALTFIEDLFDGMGNFVGTLKVRTRVTVIGKDGYVGIANGEFRDAAGNVMRSGCATIRGERIKIEPLPPQCQSITPPQ